MVGYRSTSTDLHATVLDLFPGSTPGVAQPNLSVIVGDREGATRAKSALYVNNVLVLATSSRGRLIRSMVRGVEHTLATDDAHHLELQGTALVRDRSMVFVDHRFGLGVRDEEARLRRHGWKVWDSPAVLLDLSSGHLVGPPTIDRIDREALTAISADDPLRPTELDDLGAIEADQVTWIVPEPLREHSANHVFGLMRSRVSGRCDGTAHRLSALAEFVAGGRKHHCSTTSGRQLIDEIFDSVG